MPVLEEYFALGNKAIRISDSASNIQPVIFREAKGTTARELGCVLAKALVEAGSGRGGPPVCPVRCEEQRLGLRRIGVVESRYVGANMEFVLGLWR